jgi:SpoVK/Ycf46/Vps4 family AAA+-type ATPase
MYVGQSEATAERAFAVLDALGTGVDSTHERGVVVILDEIEKTVTRGDNDGGVSMRVTARMLTWMSESTAPNMILATANDLQSMGDLADIITRRGRLDRVFFVDVPNIEGRRQLFERLLTRTLPEGKFEFQELARGSERFSGADIEAVVRDARAEARAEQQPVAMVHVMRQVERNRVRVLGQYERFSRLREWARLNAEMAGSPDGPLNS